MHEFQYFMPIRSLMNRKDGVTPASAESGSYPLMSCAADRQLLKLLSPAGYLQLNSRMTDGISGTYRRHLSNSCRELLYNERIVSNEGFSHDKDPKTKRKKDSLPVLQLDNMSTLEIFQALTSLKAKVAELQGLTDRAKSDLEILHHAKARFDLEEGFKLIELRSKETAAYGPIDQDLD
jgi:hypothetical protein